MEKIVIVGGGISGLSCLNALLDRGHSPLLIEAATVGTPKMCGEFLAPEAASLLRSWDIEGIQTIKKAIFSAKNSKFDLIFPNVAGAISRKEVELQLAALAIKKGGRLRENSPIQKIIPATAHSPYIFYLASGEEVQAQTAIFATGKYNQSNVSVPSFPYVGIKTHIKKILVPNTLMMFSVPGAYFGIVPISSEMSNCTCLIKLEEVLKVGSAKDYFFDLVSKNKSLHDFFHHLEDDWLEGSAPEFNVKSIPNWPQSFWIGDALAALHPAIGSGFAHGISSAVMAANYYVKNKPLDYLKLSKKTIRPKFVVGKFLHKILLKPKLAAFLMPFIKMNTWILPFFLRKIGYVQR